MKTCSFEGCPKRASARGWCSTHYMRWRTHGDPAVRLPSTYVRHGHAKKGAHTKEYRAWHGMLKRCNSPVHKDYALYGARGIVVCDAWSARRSGFPAFLESMGLAPSSAHSIDRIDPNGHYEPENCRWATPQEQARNKRNSIQIDGINALDWCEAHGLPYRTVMDRYRNGDRGDALARPVALNRRRQPPLNKGKEE